MPAVGVGPGVAAAELAEGGGAAALGAGGPADGARVTDPRPTTARAGWARHTSAAAPTNRSVDTLATHRRPTTCGSE